MLSRHRHVVPEQTSANPPSRSYSGSSRLAVRPSSLKNKSSSHFGSSRGLSARTSKTVGRASSSSSEPIHSSLRVSAVSSAEPEEGTATKNRSNSWSGTYPKMQSSPLLSHDKDATDAPSSIMHWSRAPVYGTLPPKMRRPSVTLLDNVAWVFGGYYKGAGTSDIYCFDTDAMHWSRPNTIGDPPSPLGGHTATLVGRKLVIFGGGDDETCFNYVYVFDTTLREWSRPIITGREPSPRRAHSAVLYDKKIWIFGGGTGAGALDDVWTLDVSDINNMRWKLITTDGSQEKEEPCARGYHTANLAGEYMIIIGGKSQSRTCLWDIWFFSFVNLKWHAVDILKTNLHVRSAHTSTLVGSYLFIQGGYDGNDNTSELLTFNLHEMRYEKRLVCGTPPSQRGYHAAVLDESRLFVFGGHNSKTGFCDVHILDLAGLAYLPQVTGFEVDCRLFSEEYRR
ncbi:galactose oxidase [Armillaria nabsnona]|nr:galactose oxidase [Armillaria nabsnona]